MPVIHRRSRPVAAPVPHAGAPVLAVRDLSYVYPDGRAALWSVSLCVERGERVALVGPNGAGKSTLMLHLNGILDPGGAVEIGGVPVAPPHLAAVRSMVGLVFQNPDDQLFSPTVFEDVAFGPLHMELDEGDVKARVREALALVGMDGYADRLSHHLSVGEKKRIALATVLAMRPELLVLDEPSAGLDPRARRSLIRLLAALPQTMVVATHDMALVRDLLPRMVVLDGGRVVVDGPTSELFEDVDLLEAHGLERP